MTGWRVRERFVKAPLEHKVNQGGGFESSKHKYSELAAQMGIHQRLNFKYMHLCVHPIQIYASASIPFKWTDGCSKAFEACEKLRQFPLIVTHHSLECKKTITKWRQLWKPLLRKSAVQMKFCQIGIPFEQSRVFLVGFTNPLLELSSQAGTLSRAFLREAPPD